MTEEMPKIEVQDELQRFMALHSYKTVNELKNEPIEKIITLDGIGFRLLFFILKLKHENI